MECSVHHIRTGDTIRIDSGQEFFIKYGSILQFGDDDTLIFDAKGTTQFGPGENLIEEKEFANVAILLLLCWKPIGTGDGLT